MLDVIALYRVNRVFNIWEGRTLWLILKSSKLSPTPATPRLAQKVLCGSHRRHLRPLLRMLTTSSRLLSGSESGRS